MKFLIGVGLTALGYALVGVGVVVMMLEDDDAGYDYGRADELDDELMDEGKDAAEE